MHNIKRAFKHVGIDLDPPIASSILKRFDSNFDGELTYSDVQDIFKPSSIALYREVERRTVFDDRHTTGNQTIKS